MRKLRTTSKLLAVGLVAVLATLFATSRADGRSQEAELAVTLRLGYFPNVTHASAIVGVEERLFEKAWARTSTLDLHDVQLGHRSPRRVPGRGSRRQLHRPEPDHHRMGQAGQGCEDRLRFHVRWHVPRRQPVDQQRRRPQGQDRGVPPARQHAGRRAAHVAEEEGAQHRHHRWRRRPDPPAGQRHHAERVQDRRPRRGLGAGAVGDTPRHTRAAASSWSTKPTSGPRAST